MATACQKPPTVNMCHLYRCRVSKSISKPGIHKPYDRENLHTIMCMYAHLSAENEVIWHTNAIVYNNVSAFWMQRKRKTKS